MNPREAKDTRDNQQLQLHHAHQVCGIVAHTKDRGIASVAIRSVAIAGCVLQDTDEQEEVLQLLTTINNETGWRLGKVHQELRSAWAKNKASKDVIQLAAPQHNQQRQMQTQMPNLQAPADTGPSSPAAGPLMASMPQLPVSTAPALAPAPVVAVPRPVVNPLLSQADFTLPNHPYQQWYRQPNRTNYNAQGIWQSAA